MPIEDDVHAVQKHFPGAYCTSFHELYCIVTPEAILATGKKPKKTWEAASALVTTTGIVHLTKGQFALVDLEDFERINSKKWHVTGTNPDYRYAVRSVYLDGKKLKTVLMHREVLQLPEGIELEVDHINHDTLDNRKRNLRAVSTQQNQFNRKASKGNSTGCVGISYDQTRSKKNPWRSYLQFDGKLVLDKAFPSFEDAKKARDAAEAKYFKL